MAEQQRRQSGRAPQRRDDAPADQYGLGLNMSLLDWNQLEPLGEAEAMAAAEQDLDFLPDLANELLDEGEPPPHISYWRRFYLTQKAQVCLRLADSENCP